MQTKQFHVIPNTLFPCLPTPAPTSRPLHHQSSASRHPIIHTLGLQMSKPSQSYLLFYIRSMHPLFSSSSFLHLFFPPLSPSFLPLSSSSFYSHRQLLQIHLSLANLTTAIHYTLASQQTSFKIHWQTQTLPNVNTSHLCSKTTLASNQTKNPLQILSSNIQNTTNQQPIHIFTIVFISVTFCFYKIFWFTCSFLLSDHQLAIKDFLYHWSTTLEFTPSRYPKLVFITNIPFQAQNAYNSFPRLFPISLDCPDNDSCYSYFMPYPMTPCVRQGYRSSLHIIIIIPRD